MIYILKGPDQIAHQRECVAHCEREGYQVVALVLDDRRSRRWADVVRMTVVGEADLIVVPDRDGRPPDRLPRVESAREDLP